MVSLQTCILTVLGSELESLPDILRFSVTFFRLCVDVGIDTCLLSNYFLSYINEKIIL
jgi:hypothetical protein